MIAKKANAAPSLAEAFPSLSEMGQKGGMCIYYLVFERLRINIERV
jgi:hypothetical protein